MSSITIPDEVRDYVINRVSAYKGITGKQLTIMLIGEFLNIDKETLRRAPAILSQEGKIMEIEYLVPGTPSQSLFLPKGSVVFVGKT